MVSRDGNETVNYRFHELYYEQPDVIRVIFESVKSLNFNTLPSYGVHSTPICSNGLRRRRPTGIYVAHRIIGFSCS
jgi:hypothetical protein